FWSCGAPRRSHNYALSGQASRSSAKPHTFGYWPRDCTNHRGGPHMRKFAILAMLALLPPFLSAARLTLRNGTVIYGQFLSGTPQVIVFQDDNGVRRRFNMNQVQAIDFLEPVSELNHGVQSADRMDEPRYSSDWTVLPVGTSISVRTDETIDS